MQKPEFNIQIMRQKAWHDITVKSTGTVLTQSNCHVNCGPFWSCTHQIQTH